VDVLLSRCLPSRVTLLSPIDNNHPICKMFKPFKPPALLKKVEKPLSVDLTGSDSEPDIQHRPNKKRKLLVHTVEEPVKKTLPPASQAVNAPRKPLLVVKNPIKTKEVASSALEEGPQGYYLVLWYVLT
jgi:DNA repair and recombination protein RAD54B